MVHNIQSTNSCSSPLATSDSEHIPESEEKDSDPYPLDGKYKDEYDRQQLVFELSSLHPTANRVSLVNRLLQMPEVEREEILSQRLEEKQQLLDKRLLSQMVQQQRGGGADESVAKAAKREDLRVY